MANIDDDMKDIRDQNNDLMSDEAFDRGAEDRMSLQQDLAQEEGDI